MRTRTFSTFLVASLLLAGCGRGDGAVQPPAAPARAADSPLYGVPLPVGAVPDAERTTPTLEAFVVPEKKNRFGDVEAFYQREMDGKPFRDYSWCGMTSDDRGQRIERVWTREGYDEVFTLALQQDPDTGPRITATTAPALGQTCPPPPLDRE